jgi:hypothetical protein
VGKIAVDLLLLKQAITMPAILAGNLAAMHQLRRFGAESAPHFSASAAADAPIAGARRPRTLGRHERAGH